MTRDVHVPLWQSFSLSLSLSRALSLRHLVGEASVVEGENSR